MTFVALLKGINVGGHKKIKMADLKAMFEALGFGNVQTYIQSGNVMFEANEAADSKRIIEQTIRVTFGFDVVVIVLSAEKVSQVLRDYPFGTIDVAREGSQVLISFLSGVPTDKAIESVKQAQHTSESFVVSEDVAYIKCPDGYGNTKLSNAFLERKFGVNATTRNWKTLLKLKALAKC